MYRTLSSPASYTLEEKRSEFIAHIFPISSRENALECVADLRIKYPDARHYCWAYIIGAAEQPHSVAFNDDGEPSGTAGKPMLHVLTQRGAGDCCAVVVRYFGGIKLGAGGLVRAYGQAVSKALDNAAWENVYAKIFGIIETNYEDEPHVRHLLNQYNAEITDVQYTLTVTLNIEIIANIQSQLRHEVSQITAGKAKISFDEKED